MTRAEQNTESENAAIDRKQIRLLQGTGQPSQGSICQMSLDIADLQVECFRRQQLPSLRDRRDLARSELTALTALQQQQRLCPGSRSLEWTVS